MQICIRAPMSLRVLQIPPITLVQLTSVLILPGIIDCIFSLPHCIGISCLIHLCSRAGKHTLCAADKIMLPQSVATRLRRVVGLGPALPLPAGAPGRIPVDASCHLHALAALLLRHLPHTPAHGLSPPPPPPPPGILPSCPRTNDVWERGAHTPVGCRHCPACGQTAAADGPLGLSSKKAAWRAEGSCRCLSNLHMSMPQTAAINDCWCARIGRTAPSGTTKGVGPSTASTGPSTAPWYPTR